MPSQCIQDTLLPLALPWEPASVIMQPCLGWEPHVEFYYAPNTNYFRYSCSNLCPK